RQAEGIDKAEDFDLPWLGPVARAALPYGDDQIAPPAMAGWITLLAAECVAPPLLHRILDQGSPLIEAGLLDPDGLKATGTELETGPYSEDPWSKLVEVITPDQAARAFLH